MFWLAFWRGPEAHAQHIRRWAPDLEKDPVLRWIGNLFALCIPLAYACQIFFVRTVQGAQKTRGRVPDLMPTVFVGGLFAIGYFTAPVLFAQLSDRTLAGNLAGTLFTLVALFGMAFCRPAHGAEANAMPEFSLLQSLTPPPLTPPDWVFGPVWTTLYVMMAVSFWRILRGEGAAPGADRLNCARSVAHATASGSRSSTSAPAAEAPRTTASAIDGEETRIVGGAVQVTNVSGPAAAAGLKAGDVLTHIDDQRTFTQQQAMNLVASSQPGQRILIRATHSDGKAFTTEAVLEERPPVGGD